MPEAVPPAATSPATSAVSGWLDRLVAHRARVLFVLIITSLLAHLPFAGVPPGGTHLWRQCNTLTVARNLAEEELNLFRPRVDRRYGTDGVTGMQFPSFEYAVAVLYRTVGFSEAIPRLLNLAFLLLGAIALYDVGWLLSRSRWVAALAAWGMAWSPELFYMGFVALPDVLALSASIVGFVGFLRWQQHRTHQDPQQRTSTINHQPTTSNYSWLLALVGFTLAGLTKLQFLIIGVPVAVLVGQNLLRKAYSIKDVALLLLLGAVSVALPLAWYAYALHLIKTSGLSDFGLEIRPAASWAEAAEILWRNLRSQLPEDLIGYAATLLLVVGLGTVRRSGATRHWFFWPALAWGSALVAYHLVELSQMRYHVYYMFPHVPLLMLGVALGGNWLRRRIPGWSWVLLLLLMPVLTMVRILPSRWVRTAAEAHGVPTDLPSREQLARLVPPNTPAVVGPDDSGCIMFYLLHQKGFGFEREGQLGAVFPVEPGAVAAFNHPAWLRPAAPPTGPSRSDTAGFALPAAESRLANYIRRGARVLYTTDTSVWQSPTLRPLLGRLLRREGALRVYALPHRGAER